MEPRRLTAADERELLAMFELIRGAFAYMDGVIDPPSSVHRLSAGQLAKAPGEPWALGDPIVACMVLTPLPDSLSVGKLAVAEGRQGEGLARRLIDHAEVRAVELGIAWLELEVRLELRANQRAFTALGFHEVERTAHPGYDRPTGITYRRRVGAAHES